MKSGSASWWTLRGSPNRMSSAARTKTGTNGNSASARPCRCSASCGHAVLRRLALPDQGRGLQRRMPPEEFAALQLAGPVGPWPRHGR
eukprot:1554490-Heterocapsa_arctica.AAC.1